MYILDCDSQEENNIQEFTRTQFPSEGCISFKPTAYPPERWKAGFYVVLI